MKLAAGRTALTPWTLTLLAGCTAKGLIFTNDTDMGKPVSWEFVQSVGGVQLGTPYLDRATNTVHIPLDHDFSGSRTITVPPTLSNSGLECSSIGCACSFAITTSASSACCRGSF